MNFEQVRDFLEQVHVGNYIGINYHVDAVNRDSSDEGYVTAEAYSGALLCDLNVPIGISKLSGLEERFHSFTEIRAWGFALPINSRENAPSSDVIPLLEYDLDRVVVKNG